MRIAYAEKLVHESVIGFQAVKGYLKAHSDMNEDEIEEHLIRVIDEEKNPERTLKSEYK